MTGGGRSIAGYPQNTGHPGEGRGPVRRAQSCMQAPWAASPDRLWPRTWIPAFAGMTGGGW